MKKQEPKQEQIQQHQTTGYMAVSKNPFRNYHIHHNAKCIVCGSIEPYMVRVGAVIFCDEHAQSEFKTDDPVMFEREIYLKWLHKSWEIQNNEEE